MTGHDSSIVLITGATGAVGPAVVAAAMASGLRVRTLSRHADASSRPGVEHIVGDIRDATVRRRALEGVEGVLHLAAVLHLVDPRAQRDAAYGEVNADATRGLAEDARDAGVRRLVFFSTIAVYGKSAPVTADESTAPRPDSPYAHSKLAAERVVLGTINHERQPLGVVLRLAAVYGPRLKGNYRTMLRHLAAGRPLPLLPGVNLRTLVFDTDVADAALLALATPAAAGCVFNVTDGTAHTLRAITASMCAALGRPAPRIGVPAGVAAAAVRIARPLLVGRLAALGAQVEKFNEHNAVNGARIRTALGFTPQVALDEGWRRTVAGLRATGELG